MAGPEGKIEIMLVDDHRVLTDGLAIALNAERDMRVCGVAGTLREASEAFGRKRPDVVLLDLNLGSDESGFAFLENVKKSAPSVRVIIVSTFDNPTFRSHAEALGADGYIAKGAPVSEIVAAVRGSAGAAPAAPESAPAPKSPQDLRRDVFNRLSPSERRMLRMLAAGLSQKEIAAKTGVSASTIGTYVQRARDKFGARSLAHLVSMAESVMSEEGQDGTV